MFRFVLIIDRKTDYNIYKNWRCLKFYLHTTIRQIWPIFNEILPSIQCLASSPISPYLSPFVGSPPFPLSESRSTPSPLSVPMKLRENGGFLWRIIFQKSANFVELFVCCSCYFKAIFIGQYYFRD